MGAGWPINPTARGETKSPSVRFLLSRVASGRSPSPAAGGPCGRATAGSSSTSRCRGRPIRSCGYRLTHAARCGARGPPVAVFQGRYFTGAQGRTYDVSPDGRQFLMIRRRVPTRTTRVRASSSSSTGPRSSSASCRRTEPRVSSIYFVCMWIPHSNFWPLHRPERGLAGSSGNDVHGSQPMLV
jgi:hypothetical protein